MMIQKVENEFSYGTMNQSSTLDKDVILSVRNVSKKFCLNLKRSMYYGLIDLTKNMIGIKTDGSYLRNYEFWALNNINFDLKRGEAIGIIGLNGSGKTTLLRVINGIFPPDLGLCAMKGRVGGLIAVGAGFHPHMTGRENIYLNGTILGMTKKEIDKKIDSIIEFAEVGKFLEAPLNTYSSGMRVRLGFSVAIHCEPDILLIDEILSVGDLSFQNKSLKRINELKKKARAILFVSHNLPHIQLICDKVIILDQGKVDYEGNPDVALSRYHNIARDHRYHSVRKEVNIDGGFSTGEIELFDHGLVNANGEETNKIEMGEDILLYFDIKTNKRIDFPVVGIGIRDEKGNTTITHRSKDDHFKPLGTLLENKHYRINVRFLAPPLMPGIYKPLLGIVNDQTGENYYKEFNLKPFIIQGKEVFAKGSVYCQSELSLEKLN